MNNMNPSENKTLPSRHSLLIASITAVVIAFLLYIIIVLPAEYNIDPTGIGKRMGLTALSETVAQEPVHESYDTANQTPIRREDVVMVTVPALKGVEYKFKLEKYANLKYQWKTIDNSKVYFDFHGEPAGDTTGYFESFTIATTNKMLGSAIVPFEGSHGWYWKNNSNQEVIIELKTSGNYQVIGLK